MAFSGEGSGTEEEPYQIENWTPIDESPLNLESSNGYSRVETLGYDVTDIKFTGSNTNPVFIQLLEVK